MDVKSRSEGLNFTPIREWILDGEHFAFARNVSL